LPRARGEVTHSPPKAGSHFPFLTSSTAIASTNEFNWRTTKNCCSN